MNQVGSHEDLSCTTESALCEESGNTQDLFEIFKCLQIEPERSKEPSPYHEGNFCSKNALRKQKHWEKKIAAKKLKRKEEKQRRKRKQAGADNQHSKHFLKAITNERLLKAREYGPRLCIDLNFTDHMSAKEVGRLAGQIRRLYGANRKALNPFHLYLTSVMTDSPIHQECVRRNDGFTNYIMDMSEENYLDIFPVEGIVYLTPDSQYALEVIDLAKVYVLGGLVDESVQKKLTFQQARANRLQTARLPIQEYMVKTKGSTKNYHSQILSINQVFDVLLTYYETGSWPEALKAGIPSGKGYVFHCTTDLTQNLHRRINA
ncbi:tRNA methyltransferase 10 homolog B [Latimeria chalumnae]|uniref:tRNA methyltransferase 10 homolog B n=1 Tax=Latimeria chalumnae TaxID=7897 RepID=UPI00313DC1B0